jgi:hypothetical protein
MKKTRLKYALYTVLIAAGIFLNLQQFFVEKWMLWQIRNEYIVVSFTTTPHRIAAMQDTVKTILAQTAPIKAIYLNIPYVFKRDNIPYVIPEWLDSEEKITILRTDDFGPATKLLGILTSVMLPDNAIIITLDDDIKYPPNTVLQLAYKEHVNPNKAIAICGSNPEYDHNGEIAAYSRNGILKNIRPDAQVAIAQGFAGIAYRRSFFDADIFAIQNAPQECINSDDVYISFYLARHNIPREILNNKFIGFKNIGWDNQLSLADDALHRLTPGPHEKHKTCISYLKQQYPDVSF